MHHSNKNYFWSFREALVFCKVLNTESIIFMIKAFNYFGYDKY